MFLKNVILMVTIKGLQKQVPHEDDIQWRITFAFRIIFDSTCKFAVDFPLINVNYLVVAVQFRLILNVLQFMANYWGGTGDGTSLLKSMQVQAVNRRESLLSLRSACVSRRWLLRWDVCFG